jgi:hypothetical protein
VSNGADPEDLLARLGDRIRTYKQPQLEVRERASREQREKQLAAKLNLGEVQTHLTAGELGEILEALADRIDAAHSTERKPESIERAYSAYKKLYTVRREQHYQDAPWSPSERIIYHWVALTWPPTVSFDPDWVDRCIKEEASRYE